jgi:hypothetical protein
MMKIRQTLIIGILLAGLLEFCVSCEEPFPELPAETQTGEGTFGCLVNNELVFSSYGKNAGASYSQSADQLQISANCQFGQQFVFLINNPYKEQNPAPIDTIRYLPPNSTGWMEATQTNSLHITRLDTVNRVVSGTFFFDLNATGTSIHVTKGRFDLTLYSY